MTILFVLPGVAILFVLPGMTILFVLPGVTILFVMPGLSRHPVEYSVALRATRYWTGFRPAPE